MQPATIRLQIQRMSQQMARSDIGQTLANLRNTKQFAREAKEFVRDAIAAVRSAPDSDPNWTDENIAQMILDRIPKGRHQ